MRDERTLTRMQTRRDNAARFGTAAAFTRVEFQALQLMCAGLTDKEIAREIGRSPAQVGHYLRLAKNYSGAINRVGLVVWCVQNRLFEVQIAAPR
jgi:DNA-binding CsgD family transcriptional regulator